MSNTSSANSSQPGHPATVRQRLEVTVLDYVERFRLLHLPIAFSGTRSSTPIQRCCPPKFQGDVPALGAGGVFPAVHSIYRTIGVESQAHHGIAEGGYLSSLGAGLRGTEAVHWSAPRNLVQAE